MTGLRLCRGRTLAFVLGLNLVFVGLLLTLTGVRGPAESSDSSLDGVGGGGGSTLGGGGGATAAVGGGPVSTGGAGDGAERSSRSVYRLPRSTPSVLTTRYFQLFDNKYCSFLNSLPSRSLVYKRCICRIGFFGSDCGIPQFFWSQLLDEGKKPMTLSRLAEPRRVIEFKFGGGGGASAVPFSNASNFTEPDAAMAAERGAESSSTGDRTGYIVANATAVCNSGAGGSSGSGVSSGNNRSTTTTTSGGHNTSTGFENAHFHRETPDLLVYTGPSQANFTCMSPRISAFSCASLSCCWNRFWLRASELSFTDLVIVDLGQPSVGPSLPGEVLDFLKMYEGYPEVLVIRRGPSVSLVATFNSVAIECNFDLRCIASCGSSKFQVINLDL